VDTYIIIALSPLLLAITGLVIALPVGLHYADKDRIERTERQVLEAQRTAFESEQAGLYRYMSTAWSPVYASVGIYSFAGHGFVGQQSFVVRSNQITTESTKAEQQTDLEPKAPLALVA